MHDTTEIVPRHLVFVLGQGDVVVQRGATIVESIRNGERRHFSDFDRDHIVTDEELAALMAENFIIGFDDFTVWLPPRVSDAEITYYYLDTKLSSAYWNMINGLLQTASLTNKYKARVRMERVTITDKTGDPFSALSEAEAALTLLKQALGEQLPALSVEKMALNPRAQETQTLRPPNFNNLIQETPTSTITDRRVLIIENDREHSQLTQNALEAIGIQTQMATRGQTALEMLMDDDPDLVIVDLQLPDIHGYQVISKIRKDPLTAKMPIIVTSRYNSEADVVFALYIAKVDEYLSKPVGAYTLRQRVVTLLNRRT